MVVALIGAGCFGLVIGWITYRTLRRREGSAAISDIAVVTGAVGGGAVSALFQDPDIFGAYAIGLAVGFLRLPRAGASAIGTGELDGRRQPARLACCPEFRHQLVLVSAMDSAGSSCVWNSLSVVQFGLAES